MCACLVYYLRKVDVMHWRKSEMGAALRIAMMILVPAAIYAAPVIHHSGQVNMRGEIMDAACTIGVESHDQTVTIEAELLTDIIAGGQGRSKAFSIDLINCVLVHSEIKPSGEKRFYITFDGKLDGEHFGLWGEASGIALQVNDNIGNTVRPGQPLPLVSVSSDNKRLDYDIRLVVNNQVVRSGSYFSAVRFKLDYF